MKNFPLANAAHYCMLPDACFSNRYMEEIKRNTNELKTFSFLSLNVSIHFPFVSTSRFVSLLVHFQLTATSENRFFACAIQWKPQEENIFLIVHSIHRLWEWISSDSTDCKSSISIHNDVGNGRLRPPQRRRWLKQTHIHVRRITLATDRTVISSHQSLARKQREHLDSNAYLLFNVPIFRRSITYSSSVFF